MSLSERHRAGGALVGVLAIALVVTAFIPDAIASDPLLLIENCTAGLRV